MSPSLYPVVGTIRVERAPHGHASRPGCDDSSLELLLASFAHHAVLSDDAHEPGQPICLVATRRLNWLPASSGEVAVRANLAQLIDDLEAEFEELGGVAT